MSRHVSNLAHQEQANVLFAKTDVDFCEMSLCVAVRVMENEDGRKEYLVFPPSKNHCPASGQKGRKIPLKGNGRRIDYILYSDESLQQDWKLVGSERALKQRCDYKLYSLEHYLPDTCTSTWGFYKNKKESGMDQDSLINLPLKLAASDT